MKTSSHLPRVFTHVLALLAGLGLAALASRGGTKTEVPGKGPARSTTNTGAEAANRSAARGGGKTRADEYRQAWDDLAEETMSASRRADIQWRLLKAWAMVDIEGALTAAKEEGFLNSSGAFDEAFMANPRESWTALRKLGLGSMELTTRWAQMVALKDPDAMIAVLGEMPPRLRRDAAGFLFEDVDSDEAANKLKEKVLRIDASEEEMEMHLRQAWLSAPLLPEDRVRVDGWLDLPAGTERLHAMTGWASGLRYQDPATIGAEWEKIPTADRAQAARLLLNQVGKQLPGIRFAVDRAIEGGQWQTLRDNGGAEYFSSQLMKGEPEELAQWALTLPHREEVGGYFADAILPKLTKDPEAGRAWLESLPEGSWQRDEGYAALAQETLKKGGDWEAVVEEISDAEIRRRAEERKRDWEVRKR
ncbi:hypothetical protein [Haloferula sp. BvORR071]|uniref:hypothetical protein n=1 Tax=Haloferula sp. BvORR071 TaxID=1396141 RepID=UPI0005580573|nr:hypothetical protein [Haloferula sp. BvORR071]